MILKAWSPAFHGVKGKKLGVSADSYGWLIKSCCLGGIWVGETFLHYGGLGEEQFVHGGVGVYHFCLHGF